MSVALNDSGLWFGCKFLQFYSFNLAFIIPVANFPISMWSCPPVKLFRVLTTSLASFDTVSCRIQPGADIPARLLSRMADFNEKSIASIKRLWYNLSGSCWPVRPETFIVYHTKDGTTPGTTPGIGTQAYSRVRVCWLVFLRVVINIKF